MLQSACVVVQMSVFEFRCRAQVDDGAHAPLGQHIEFGIGKAVHGIGAVQRAPSHRAAIGGRIAAEVAEVVSRLQGHVTVGVRDGVAVVCGGHGVTLDSAGEVTDW